MGGSGSGVWVLVQVGRLGCVLVKVALSGVRVLVLFSWVQVGFSWVLVEVLVVVQSGKVEVLCGLVVKRVVHQGVCSSVVSSFQPVKRMRHPLRQSSSVGPEVGEGSEHCFPSIPADSRFCRAKPVHRVNSVFAVPKHNELEGRVAGRPERQIRQGGHHQIRQHRGGPRGFDRRTHPPESGIGKDRTA